MTRDATHQAWLDQVIEPVIDPSRAIVDPHHHLWRVPGSPRWGTYDLDDLFADTGSGHRIEQTVFIDCTSDYRTDGPEEMRPLGETEYVAAMAEESARRPDATTRIGGIVGHADLLLGARVADVLAAHLEVGKGYFRGIRHAASWDPSEEIHNGHHNPPREMLLSEQFRAGFAELAPMGLTFEAWLYHPQIPELTDLARAFPDTGIILNHVGGHVGIGPYAGKRDELLAGWRRDMAELATCTNVSVKLGGLAMPINGYDWHKRERPASSDEVVAAHRDIYLHCIDLFGPDRCMFESNFPVDRLSVSYAVLWNAFKKIAAGFSEDEQERLFRGTAMRVYDLDEID
ncbi:amidohydrolase family protein [Oceanibacterium hippocampi]|uniref:Amidohydrolase n=1 Tax=Oceanibacterium hippocampi TaxID=745714 RepID=A0A1Y5TW09_9PROT|nr:amidohydrolase family protein [Oceanibacterium hippocampi]SLN74678.1 Amidohydrolase [Oceanibacterium hippocampi]